MIGFSFKHYLLNKVLPSKLVEVDKLCLSYPSKGLVVMNTKTYEVLYEQNAHTPLPPASITKILTCLCAIKYMDLNDNVLITNEMLNVEGSKMYLKPYELINLKDILYGLMLVSGNDAAMAIALHYSPNINDFIDLMNFVARDIGMNDSSFNNPHGLDDNYYEHKYNMVSAYDMALLYSKAIKNDIFKKITSSKQHYCDSLEVLDSNMITKHYLTNKHRLIPKNIATGGKTGVFPS